MFGQKKVLKSTKGAPGYEQEGHGVAAADFEGCRHDNNEPGEETRETGGKKHLSWTKQLLEEAAKEGKNHWRNILKCSLSENTKGGLLQLILTEQPGVEDGALW